MKGLALLALLIAGPAFAQEKPPGPPPIDPTKNVLDLVLAQEKFQNMAREYEAKLRDAEMRRLKELYDQKQIYETKTAEQKQLFDLETAKVLRANQDDASKLLATQLKEVKTDLSDRVSKTERFQYETSGKSSGASDLWVILIGIAGIVLGGLAVVMRTKPAGKTGG